MSKIHKLSIRGIRSFDPNEEQEIRFYSPLTIIVGKNGCGKTTIIECLKYATTGVLPPTTKGGAFINDPKLTNATKVCAQVKLVFCNVAGRKMQIIRSMELSQTKTKLTMKTIAGTLVAFDPKTNKPFSTNQKAINLEEEIPANMGVSKAILEHVIFCHQEESLWPLADASTLKKQFDEIFAATRYTKALDNLKSIRKDKVAHLKVEQNELQHLKENYAKSSRIMKSRQELNKGIDDAELRIAILDGGEIEKLVEQMTHLMDQNRGLQDVKSKLDSKKLEHDMISKNIDVLQQNMEVYKESDQELLKLLDNHKKSLDVQILEQNQLENQKQEYEKKLLTIDSDLSEKLTDRGRFQAEEIAHERRVKDLGVLILDLCNRYEMTTYHSGDSLSDAEKLSDSLVSKIKNLESRLSAWRQTEKEKEGSLFSELQSIRSAHSSLEDSKKSLRKQIENTNDKIQGFEHQLNSSTATDSKVSELKKKLSDEEANIISANAEFNLNDAETKLRDLSAELQSQEYKLSSVNEEMSILNRQSNTRAKLGINQQDLNRKKENILQMQSSNELTFKEILGSVFNPKTSESELKICLREKESLLKISREKNEAKSAQLLAIESQISFHEKNMKLKLAKYQEIMSKIVEVFGEQNFIETRDSTEKKYEEAKEFISTFQSASSMYEKFISKFESKKCCPLCSRGYPNEDEEKKFMEKLKSNLARFPTAVEASKAQLIPLENLRNQYREYQSNWDDSQRILSIEIPELKKQLSTLEDQKIEMASDLDDLSVELAGLETECQNIRKCLGQAEEIGKLEREIEALESEISSISTELSISGSVKTMSEIQTEHDLIHSTCQNLRKESDRLNKEIREKHREIQMRENMVRDAKDRLQKAESELLENKKLKKIITELGNEVSGMQKEIEEIDLKAKEYPPMIKELDAKISDYRDEMSCQEAEKTTEINQIFQSENNLRTLLHEISRFKEENGSSCLEKCNNEIKTLEKNSLDIKSSVKQISKKIEDMQNMKYEINIIQRAIDDNLQYRRLRKEQDELNQTCNLLSKEISEFDTASIESQYNRLKKTHASLVGERAGLVGELKQMQEQAKRLDMELATEYLNVEEQYRDHLILVGTETMAIDDLEKYSKALDTAIVEYHSAQLKQINDIIRELWRKTYRGNDIDTIEIRSDVEKVRLNRSYNYRVVMVRNETELDMRGRCSAGQKVLASIIIRLALAETFCLNCGILALDEPTTNLDEPNMESLAEGLVRIIEARKDQLNFQLLIITHDDRFMEMLGRSDHTDYYWRVSKNDEGFSQLTRQDSSHIH